MARCRGLGTVFILDNSRTFRGRVWRSNYGLRSAASAAGIHRAHARSSASGCQASLAPSGAKLSEPQKSCGSSATWPEVFPDNDCWPDCPSPPVMTRFSDACESNRRKHRQSRFTTWASMTGLGGKAKIMERSWSTWTCTGSWTCFPDRAAESFSEWLKQHPEIVTISRDRCGLYAEGATLGRTAIAAGRRSLSSGLESLGDDGAGAGGAQPATDFAAHRSSLRRNHHQRMLLTPAKNAPPPVPTRVTQSQLRRQRRLERYQQVMALFNSGQSPGSDQSRPRHGKEDHSALAAARRVSRAEAASPSSPESERVCRLPPTTLE